MRLRPQLLQVAQQSFVGGKCVVIHYVVGMNDETHQTVFPKDQVDLGFPQINGTFIQDVEQDVVLSRSHWDL